MNGRKVPVRISSPTSILAPTTILSLLPPRRSVGAPLMPVTDAAVMSALAGGALLEAATFFLLAAICVVSYVWIRRNVPETRGRTLEEIQDLWNPSTTRPRTAATPDP